MRIMAEGFALGLATGPYCFAACAPFLVPYLCSEGNLGFLPNLRLLLLFLVGRAGAYLCFGALAGAAGGLIGSSLPPWVSALALGASAVMMLGYACAKTLSGHASCAALLKRGGIWGLPMSLGFLTGINVCPPFVAGLVRVMSLGHALSGLLFFAAFFASTSLYLLPVLGLWPWVSHERVRRIGRVALFLAGTWYLIQAGLSLLTGGVG